MKLEPIMGSFSIFGSFSPLYHSFAIIELSRSKGEKFNERTCSYSL